MIRPAVMLLMFVCALLAGACGSDSNPGPTSPTPPVNTAFTLAPGQSAEAGDGAVSVRFLRVVTDARCPGDALCIAGVLNNAVLAFDIRVPSSTSGPYELKLAGDGRTLQLGPYTFALETLTPYPFASLGPIPPADYRATLRVTSTP